MSKVVYTSNGMRNDSVMTAIFWNGRLKWGTR